MAEVPYTFVGPKPGQIVGAAQAKLLIAAQVYEQQKILNDQHFQTANKPSLQSLLQEPPHKKLKPDFHSYSQPLQQLPVNIRLPLSATSTMGRNTNNSNQRVTKNSKDTKKHKEDKPKDEDQKKNKEDVKGKDEDKENKENTTPESGSNFAGGPNNQVPPKNLTGGPTPSPTEPTPSLADTVIRHFSTHWDTFIAGFKTDVTSLASQVETLETTTASLETCVAALKSQPVAPSTSNAGLLARIAALENKCSDTDPQGYSAQLKTIENRLEKISEEDAEGTVSIKQSEEFYTLQSDVGYLQRNVGTISGYMHIMDCQVKSRDHRSTMNAAKLMRNTLIFGGVRSTPEQPPLEALKIFLTNILRVNPGPDDIIEISYLGKGYTRWVPDENKEIPFPPPIKAKCTDAFAARVMHASPSLSGKKDEEYRFKYYV